MKQRWGLDRNVLRPKFTYVCNRDGANYFYIIITLQILHYHYPSHYTLFEEVINYITHYFAQVINNHCTLHLETNAAYTVVHKIGDFLKNY